MEQTVIVLVIAAVTFIKWLMEKSAEQRSQRETEKRIDELERENPPAPPPRGVRPIDPFPKPAVAARRLREALGLPPESDLLPSLPTFRREEIKVVPVADLEQRVFDPVPLVPQLPPPVVRRKEPAPEAAPSARSGLDALLHSREGLRKAILMQEILGTPKGLVF